MAPASVGSKRRGRNVVTRPRATARSVVVASGSVALTEFGSTLPCDGRGINAPLP
jgi:hypothetical protein